MQNNLDVRVSELEHRMDIVQQRMNKKDEIAHLVANDMLERIISMQELTYQHVLALDKRVSTIDQRLSSLEDKVDTLAFNFNKLTHRVNSIEESLAEFNGTLGTTVETLALVVGRLDSIDKKLTK